MFNYVLTIIIFQIIIINRRPFFRDPFCDLVIYFAIIRERDRKKMREWIEEREVIANIHQKNLTLFS